MKISNEQRFFRVEWLKQLMAVPLYTNSLHLIAIMAASTPLSFIFWIVAARFYTATNVGFASAIISVAALLLSLSSLGLDVSLARFLAGKANIPRYRKFGIDVITFLYNFGSRTRVSDAQSCFRGHSRRLLEAINITENGFGFSVEVLVQARNKGFAITEVPVSCICHSHSSSMNPVVHGLGVAWDVVKLRLTSW